MKDVELMKRGIKVGSTYILYEAITEIIDGHDCITVFTVNRYVNIDYEDVGNVDDLIKLVDEVKDSHV